jgi:thiamine biosynthesis lipoprotein
MHETRIVMGMPITLTVVGTQNADVLELVFAHFVSVDRRFSPYKTDSELSTMNRGACRADAISSEMQDVLALSELTRHETEGYFDIRRPDGTIDPSGLVKGWAIRNAARLLDRQGVRDYLIEAGGDIQCRGTNDAGAPWRIGIRNPFDETEIVKVLAPGDCGVATSGLYVRGAHIYNPHAGCSVDDTVASLTVVGADVYEADRFATAAFAMGRDSIAFIEGLPGLEAYAIDRAGIATMTSGFSRIVAS